MHLSIASAQSLVAKKGIWFPMGFSNLFHALSDIRRADTAGAYSLVCSHPSPQFVGLAAADVALTEPLSESAFLAFAVETIRVHSIRVVVPSRRQELFNRHPDLWRQLGVTVLTVASTRNLRRIDQKAALYHYLKPKDIVAIPAFATFKSTAEFDTTYAALKARHETVCIKPAYGVYGSGFRILKDSPDRLADLLSESLYLSVAGLRARLDLDAGATMLVMQYLEGAERSVDCLADKGQLLAGIIRRKHSAKIAGQVIEDNPAMMEQVRALTACLGLNGLFNVQFKDHGGVPYLLEINARMSGRSYYATVAGCNLPYLACERFASGRSLEELQYTVQHGICIGNVTAPVPVPVPVPASGPEFRSLRESA